MKSMMTAEELSDNLSGFNGTEVYHAGCVLFSKCVLTDGVKFLADNAECYWMIDAIASHIVSASKKDARCKDMQFWTFRKGTPHKLICEADSDKVVITQEYEMTDFPLDEIKIWAAWNGRYWVLMLPSEY